MNVNHNPKLTLGANICQPKVRINRFEKSISPVATVLLAAGLITILQGMAIAPICLFSICLLFCAIKLYLLHKHRQSGFTWLFNFVITGFLLTIAILDWKLKIN